MSDKVQTDAVLGLINQFPDATSHTVQSEGENLRVYVLAFNSLKGRDSTFEYIVPPNGEWYGPVKVDGR